jgi:tetratricopeptide (TPR) repeat protein
LAGRSGQALIRLLDEGRTSLETGDGLLAQQKFSAVLMIDSANPAARRGLERARTIEAVTALIASGRQHEAGGDLSLAAADYQKALQLDAFSQKARKALASVNGRIKEARFQQLVSEGLAAFHNNDYPVARQKLISAKALKPNSLEVQDALSQVDQAMRLARIDKLQQQALAAEQTENWQQALKSYQAVLEVDKNVQFANRGKTRAAEQIRIAKRLDFFLAQPDILESDSQLKNAILLLSEAGDVAPQGPKLADRIIKLQRRVSIAKTPQKITIESDNLTQVVVYKVGRLGRFEVRELELRPGTYTVVGARDGYQDVRQKIVVKPGRPPIRVTIKCRVKI